MRVGEGLRHLSRLVALLGALAILGSPLGERVAEAAAKVKVPNKAAGKSIKAKMGKTTGKEFERRSTAARKGWAMRRMKDKANASLASKMKTDSALAASPEKQASFFNRSMASQKGWEARKANMAGGGKAAARTKVAKATTSKAKKTSKSARKTTKKKQTKKSQRKNARKKDKKKKNEALAAAAPAPETPAAEQAQVDAEPEQPEMEPEAFEETGPSRRSKILRRVGIGAAIIGGAALGVAGGWALFPIIGGLTALGGIPGTAIVGAVVGAGMGGGTALQLMGGGGGLNSQQRQAAIIRQREGAGMNMPGGLNGNVGVTQPGQLGNMIDPGGPQ